MAVFTVNITDAGELAAITKAREAANNALPTEYETDKDGNQVAKDKSTYQDYLATDAAYMQHVMKRAAESYKKQFGNCITCGKPL